MNYIVLLLSTLAFAYPQQSVCDNHCQIKRDNCKQGQAQCDTNLKSCLLGCTVGRDFFDPAEFPQSASSATSATQPVAQTAGSTQTCQDHCEIKRKFCKQGDAQCNTNLKSCLTGCTVGRDFFDPAEFPNA